MTTQPEIRLTGSVQHILSHNTSSGFAIMRVSLGPMAADKLPAELVGANTVTVTGTLHGAKVGGRLRIVGSLAKHDKYGWQVKATRMVRAHLLRRAGDDLVMKTGCFGIFTKDEMDQARVACKDLDKQLSEGTLEKSLDTLPNTPLLKRFVRAWADSEHLRAAGGFLDALGLGPDALCRILAVYGTGTIDQVSRSPYRLLGVPGIGYKTADLLANRLGFAVTASDRLSQSMTHLVRQARERGDTVVSPSVLITGAAKITGTDSLILSQTLQRTVKVGRLASGAGFVGGAEMVMLEREIAERLRERIGSAVALPLGPEGAALYDEQRIAADALLGANVSILTGGPGVGKTRVTKALLEALEVAGDVLLVAPTGTAARRMSEVTGKPAFTIYQVLEFIGNGTFAKNEENPLAGAAMILDEASMVDVFNMAHLLRAMPKGMRLILVGDKDQLPSVDAGNVLGDLIDSEVIPVARLTQARRQAEGSMIIEGAHAFMRGELPEGSLDTGDFRFIKAQGDMAIADTIERLMTHTLPEMGFTLANTQVLSPQRTTPAGVQALNRRLQQSLNPNKEGIHLFGERYSIGDPIMQVINSHDRGLVNGHPGKIVHADIGARSFMARFDERLLKLAPEHIAQIRLAYAATVHKFQGSEREAIVVPVSGSHRNMLTRRLLYTSLTRGKKQVFFVGEEDALMAGLANTADAQRQTQLARLLRFGPEPVPSTKMAVGF